MQQGGAQVAKAIRTRAPCWAERAERVAARQVHATSRRRPSCRTNASTPVRLCSACTCAARDVRAPKQACVATGLHVLATRRRTCEHWSTQTAPAALRAWTRTGTGPPCSSTCGRLTPQAAAVCRLDGAPWGRACSHRANVWPRLQKRLERCPGRPRRGQERGLCRPRAQR